MDSRPSFEEECPTEGRQTDQPSGTNPLFSCRTPALSFSSSIRPRLRPLDYRTPVAGSLASLATLSRPRFRRPIFNDAAGPPRHRPGSRACSRILVTSCSSFSSGSGSRSLQPTYSPGALPIFGLPPLVLDFIRPPLSLCHRPAKHAWLDPLPSGLFLRWENRGFSPFKHGELLGVHRSCWPFLPFPLRTLFFPAPLLG